LLDFGVNLEVIVIGNKLKYLEFKEKIKGRLGSGL
jgi:hypothetical protein